MELLEKEVKMPNQTTPQTSSNHIGFNNGYEYFTVILGGIDKGMYRASQTNFVGNDGYRVGARCVIASHLLTPEQLALYGLKKSDTVLNLWKTAVIATKMKISNISIEIENLFFADQLNTPAHLSLEAERAELNANLNMLFDIKSFVGA